jgi:hypothetical protein
MPRGLTVEVSPRVVDQVVLDWAGHGRPFTLRVGDATYTQGSGGEALAYEPVDFLRRTAGRAPADGLLGAKAVLW